MLVYLHNMSTTDPIPQTPPPGDPTGFSLSQLRILPLNPESNFQPDHSEIQAVLVALAKSRGKIGSFSHPTRALAARLGLLLDGDTARHMDETHWINVARAMAEKGIIQAIVNPQNKMVQIRLLPDSSTEEDITDDDEVNDEVIPDWVQRLIANFAQVSQQAMGKTDDETLAYADSEITKANDERDSQRARADKLAARVLELESRPTAEQLTTKKDEEIAALQKRLGESEQSRRETERRLDDSQRKVVRLEKDLDLLSARVQGQTNRADKLQLVVDSIAQEINQPSVDPKLLLEAVKKVANDLRTEGYNNAINVILDLLEVIEFDKMEKLIDTYLGNSEMGAQMRNLMDGILASGKAVANISRKSARKFNSAVDKHNLLVSQFQELAYSILEIPPEEDSGH